MAERSEKQKSKKKKNRRGSSVLSEKQLKAIQFKGDVFTRILGSGKYGLVAHCVHPSLKLEFALKLSTADSASLASEQQHLANLSGHPNIVPFYGGWKYEDMHVIRMGYIKGSTLLDILIQHPLSEELAFSYFKQLVSALHHAHDRCRIVHRDLKAENIMVAEDGSTVLIIDWGMAMEWSLAKKFTQDCGSPHYAAPEIFQKRSYFGPEVDIWSLGVTLYAMVTSNFPFPGEDPLEIAYRVVRGIYETPFVSRELVDLISRMLTVSQEHRISLAEIRNHSWFKRYAPCLVSPQWTDVDLNRKLLSIETDRAVCDSVRTLVASSQPVVKKPDIVPSPWVKDIFASLRSLATAIGSEDETPLSSGPNHQIKGMSDDEFLLTNSIDQDKPPPPLSKNVMRLPARASATRDLSQSLEHCIPEKGPSKRSTRQHPHPKRGSKSCCFDLDVQLVSSLIITPSRVQSTTFPALHTVGQDDLKDDRPISLSQNSDSLLVVPYLHATNDVALPAIAFHPKSEKPITPKSVVRRKQNHYRRTKSKKHSYSADALKKPPCLAEQYDDRAPHSETKEPALMHLNA